jgi:hypothetical protein
MLPAGVTHASNFLSSFYPKMVSAFSEHRIPNAQTPPVGDTYVDVIGLRHLNGFLGEFAKRKKRYGLS